MFLNDVINLCNDKNEMLAFLQCHGIIKERKICVKCNKECVIMERNGKFIFVCNKCKNKYTVSPKGYVLYKSKVDYDIALQLMFMFVNELRVVDVVSLINVKEKVVIDYYKLFREICMKDLLKRKKKIGGVSKTVEIDESMFGKRKYNRGRLVNGTWVVGGVERESKACFLKIVEKRDAKTLIKLITENVETGTVIVTDEWKGYKELIKANYSHKTVNHSKHFKNPETGETTNKIESTWAKVS